MPITGMSLAVVGADYPNKRGPTRRFAIGLCRPGDPITLEPEPKNPADPNAVMVLNADGMQMGYITAERAPWIKRLIGDAVDLKPIFQEATDYGAVIRVSLDENFPDLPPERDAPAEDPDFWPDPIYDDE